LEDGKNKNKSTALLNIKTIVWLYSGHTKKKKTKTTTTTTTKSKTKKDAYYSGDVEIVVQEK